MKPLIFNLQSCRMYGNRYNDGNSMSNPKLTMHRNGKFTITNPVYKAINSDFVEIQFDQENGKLYLAASTEETGFKLRNDGKTSYKSFNSAGLYKALSLNCFKPAEKKRVKSASLEVIIPEGNSTSKLLEVNYSKPLYYTEEFNPDAK